MRIEISGHDVRIDEIDDDLEDDADAEIIAVEDSDDSEEDEEEADDVSDSEEAERRNAGARPSIDPKLAANLFVLGVRLVAALWPTPPVQQPPPANPATDYSELLRRIRAEVRQRKEAERIREAAERVRKAAEAREAARREDPAAQAAALLGVSLDVTEDEIRAALRARLVAERLHPDQGGDVEMAKTLIAAQNLLVERARARRAP